MIERARKQIRVWQRELVNEMSCCVISIGCGFVGLIAGSGVLGAAGVGVYLVVT